MTIEEFENYAEDAENKSLRVPKSFNSETREGLMMAHEQFVFIIDKIIRNPNREYYITNSLFFKSIRRRIGIQDLKRLNNCVGSYEIKSELGNGVFFDAHKLFIDGEYPTWIKPNYCFSNSHLYILQTKLEATILSGIAFVGKPFLHSILLIDDNVIDFNYDLVMSKNLYFALTHFEVLAELSYKQLLENEQIIKKIKGVQSHVFNFAFEEVIEKERMKQKIFNEVGV